MSWWDTSGLTSLASQALKNAQKKIDKVLDIEEGASAKKKDLQLSNKVAPTVENESQEVKQDGDFWSSWLGPGGKKSMVEDESASSHSSWSHPWNTAGSTSEHTVEAGSKVTTVDSVKTPETRYQTSDVSTPTSEVALVLEEIRPGSLTAQTKEAKSEFSQPEVSHPEISHVLPEADAHNTHIEQSDIMTSESFTTDWQDFPMDVPEPENESPGYDVPKLEVSDPEFAQNSDQKIDVMISTETNMKSDESETSDRKDILPDSLLDVESGKVNADQTGKTDESAFEDYTSNVSMPSIDINLEPPKEATQNDAVRWSSPAEIIHTDSGVLPVQTMLQEPEPCQKTNLTSDTILSVCDSKDKNINLDLSSKTSSSSSFIAVSEDSAIEIVPSLVSSVISDDIFPQGSSAAVREAETALAEAVDTENFNSDNASDLSIPVKLDQGSMPVSSDISEIRVPELPDMNSDFGTEIKNCAKHSENIVTVLPELMISSDYQKSQSDFMQEYVNVSAMSDVSQTISFEGSAILSDDLHTSNDMEMGNSRTSSDLDLPGGGSTGSSDTGKFDSSIDTVVDQSVLDSQSDVDLMEKDPPYSLFGDSHVDGGVMGTSLTGHLDDSSQSLSSSYVKCMIEEAMEDLSKTEDSGSDNHSSGEKSESSKVDSELEKSVYSGHESSDEIETTTSSDIEIISAPANNGDNKYHIPFDLSPFKIALQRSARDQGHHRSDSQSSSSAHSKAGEIDRLSPERGEGALWRDDDFHHHDLHAVREEGADNPSHPDRLLKLAQLVVQHKLLGGQKLAEMAEVLQARENKLVQLSKENHQLTEDNSILRNQLQQSEDTRELENADLTALTDEFTTRIGEAEKKMQAVLKEKEMLKQKLASAEKELERRSAHTGLQALLEEKTEQALELMKEGEKLSKQQLQSSTIIKKLRAKEKESDVAVTAQKKKLDEQEKELERLTTVLDSKEEMEKKQTEAINQLNTAVQRQEKDINKYKSDLEDAQEKCRGLQVALDNSYKEIAELHRSNASQDSKAQEAALSAETHVREELKAAMEREQQRFRQDRETFIMQIDDLRLDMARLEKEHNRREDLLRQEINHLQERLQQDEARSQDLTQSVTSATRPLLRQIENLQATLVAQSAAWERVEKSLTDRLAEAQTALAIAQEKERTANDHLMEVSARVTSLEGANSRIKQERAQLAAQVDSDRSRLEELQDIRNSAVAELESNKQRLSQETSQLKMDKIYLESQLNVERTRLENEKKKSIALEEQLRQAERPRSRGTPSPSPSMSVSRQESMAGSMYEQQTSGTMGWSFHDDGESVSTYGGTKTSVYDSLRQSGAAVVVENLSSQLKLREGELLHMQSEVSQLERTRESMARELVNLTNQNDELLEMKKSHEQLQEQFNELNGRYSAILQMYGEKEEQVQELRLDLQDVKEMYKSQIDALLAK